MFSKINKVVVIKIPMTISGVFMLIKIANLIKFIAHTHTQNWNLLLKFYTFIMKEIWIFI